MSRGWNGFVAKSGWMPKSWRERAERALAEDQAETTTGVRPESAVSSAPEVEPSELVTPSPATPSPTPQGTPTPAEPAGREEPTEAAPPDVAVPLVDPVAFPVTSAAPIIPLSIAITDFVLADDSVIGPASVLDNLELTKAAVTRVAAAILDTEGPIAVPRLVTIVARRFGVDRLAEGSRTELSALVTEAFVVQNGFAWPVDLDIVTWRGVRRVVHRDHRAITDISPAEICNAMELVLAANPEHEVDREQLPMQAASVLGYGRLGETARRWLDLTLAQAINHGRLVEDGDRIRLP
ncbi:MAG TPA: hypothetical protein VNJ54_12580 [Plantibacter sp.]|uniref:hypothetical protein n=1 Tax=unclassified Plantibacter TaxID=2624265 RepID=UPI002CAE6859|nr:hypothetical protein [Plantibacter sp.]